MAISRGRISLARYPKGEFVLNEDLKKRGSQGTEKDGEKTGVQILARETLAAGLESKGSTMPSEKYEMEKSFTTIPLWET